MDADNKNEWAEEVLSKMRECRRTVKGSDLTAAEEHEMILDFSNAVFDQLTDEQLQLVKRETQSHPDLASVAGDAATLIEGKLALRRIRAES